MKDRDRRVKVNVDLLSTWLVPRSKGDDSLPHTYEARVDQLNGQTNSFLPEHYHADTLCGLVELLDREEISPARTRLFGVYHGFQLPIETWLCSASTGVWLSQPEICRSLERHFRKTGIERYRGHQAEGDCAFVNRNRKSIGI